MLVELGGVGLALTLAGVGLCSFALWRRPTALRSAAWALALAASGVFLFVAFFAYEEEEVRFRNGDVALAGSLFLPSQAGPHPAVVLLHGAAPAFSVRAPYRLFADAFARQGFAVLIYDKRSFGASGGALPFDYHDLASDAAAGFDYLRQRPDVDGARMGFWGISEGGWTAPLAASRVSDPAFLVVVSGAGVTPARSTAWEVEARMKAADESARAIERALELRERIDVYYRSGRGGESTWAEVHRAKGEAWFQTAFDIGGDQVPASIDDLESDRADYRRVLDFDAVPIVRALELPMLFLFGANDEQIPARESAENLRAALSGAAARDVQIRVFPDANHVLMTPAFRFAPGFLEAMTDWMRAHATPGRGPVD